LRSNIGYLRRSTQEYAIVVGSYVVFNTTFNDMVRFHEETGADITVMCSKAYSDARVSSSMLSQHAYLRLGEDGQVRDLEIGPNIPTYPHMSMDVVMMKRTLLIHLVDQAAAHGMTDLHRDLLTHYVRNHLLKVMAYEYKGYQRRVESILGYYNFNMDMLDTDIRTQFFGQYPVYTKIRDEVPARYVDGAQAVNSLVADGCIVEGSVIGSVLFRGVRVRRGAVVRNSVLMQESDIQEGVEVENVILDKAVTVRQGRLIGQKGYPIVIGKNMTL
jgi:glucose-1-phosphate adenylyltransferase